MHYVSYGTPKGEYTSQCRAAIIAGVQEDSESYSETVQLVVLNPEGLFFNTSDHHEPTGDIGSPDGGTWHWPERI